MLLVFFVLLSALAINVYGEKCEVCVKVLGDFDAFVNTQLESSGKKRTDVVIGDLLEKFCEKIKNRKENKLCYNLLPMKKDVSRQIKFKKGSMKICESLNKKNPEFCTIRYPVKTDASTDYSKLRIKQLKNILSDRGVDCKGCLEKPDYVKRCKDTEHMEL